MYTDETQILIMLFSKPKKNEKILYYKKMLLRFRNSKTMTLCEMYVTLQRFTRKKGESGGKKGRKTQFSIRQLLRVDLIVEIDSWS